MYECCIFDLDGTLLNTLTAISYTANRTLAAFGYSPIEREEYRHLVGDGAAKLVERMLKIKGDEQLVHFDEALALYLDNFSKYCNYEVEPYEGMEMVLTYLKAKGVKLAVLSNKPHARTVENIEAAFGKDLFDYIQGEEPGMKRKPDPSGIYHILNVLRIKPENCLYVGDTDTDMMTGENAGVDTVGVTWGFRQESELEAFCPDYIVDYPYNIKEICDLAFMKKILDIADQNGYT